MGSLKPWQVVLFVVAGIVLAGSVLWLSLSGDKIHLADSVILVDVRTGELFEFDTSGHRGVVLPEINPDTGEATLLPVIKEEDGDWVIGQTYLGDLRTIEGDTPAVLDAESGAVKVASDRPRKI